MRKALNSLKAMACTLPAGYADGSADCSSAACTVLTVVVGVGVVATGVDGAELPPPPPQPVNAPATAPTTNNPMLRRTLNFFFI